MESDGIDVYATQGEGLYIRPATADDIPDVADIHRRSITGICSAVYPSEQIEAWLGLLTTSRYHSMLRERRFLVAELDGEVAGFGIVDPPAELLNALYVAPESTGRGVGSALLLALEEIAIASGRTSLWLEATLNAASFYEARGWQRVASSAAEFPSGVTLPSVNMARMLRAATGSNRIGSTA